MSTHRFRSHHVNHTSHGIIPSGAGYVGHELNKSLTLIPLPLSLPSALVAPSARDLPLPPPPPPPRQSFVSIINAALAVASAVVEVSLIAAGDLDPDPDLPASRSRRYCGGSCNVVIEG